MPTASQILALYDKSGYPALEAAVPGMARTGGIVTWPLIPVSMVLGAATLTIQVASDYVAIGTPNDCLYVPLTPEHAQEVADVWGMLLPTCAMVKAIHEQAQIKLAPIRSGDLSPPQPNKGADLRQIRDHSIAIQSQMTKLGLTKGLTSGTKKDIVLGNLWKPGKVLIYGWCKGAVPPGPDPQPMIGDPAHDIPPWRIQMYSNVHGSSYYDYSHGVRLVSPKATLNGLPVDLAALLTGREAAIASWEGPLRTARYPTPGKPVAAPVAYVPTNPGLATQGLQEVLRRDL